MYLADGTHLCCVVSILLCSCSCKILFCFSGCGIKVITQGNTRCLQQRTVASLWNSTDKCVNVIRVQVTPEICRPGRVGLSLPNLLFMEYKVFGSKKQALEGFCFENCQLPIVVREFEPTRAEIRGFTICSFLHFGRSFSLEE